jgi:hypothetical protein
VEPWRPSSGAPRHRSTWPKVLLPMAHQRRRRLACGTTKKTLGCCRFSVFLFRVQRFQCFSRKFRPYTLQSATPAFHSRSRKFRSFARKFRTSNLNVTAVDLRVFIPLCCQGLLLPPLVSDLIDSSSLTLALTPTYSTTNPCIALKWVVIPCEIEHWRPSLVVLEHLKKP